MKVQRECMNKTHNDSIPDSSIDEWHHRIMHTNDWLNERTNRYQSSAAMRLEEQKTKASASEAEQSRSEQDGTSQLVAFHLIHLKQSTNHNVTSTHWGAINDNQVTIQIHRVPFKCTRSSISQIRISEFTISSMATSNGYHTYWQRQRQRRRETYSIPTLKSSITSHYMIKLSYRVGQKLTKMCN